MIRKEDRLPCTSMAVADVVIGAVLSVGVRHRFVSGLVVFLDDDAGCWVLTADADE
ncbi:hypothetical protein [Streptomyces sp. NBC_00046]|uniref:hypothetical protein n=1 Tax=unclassified Streptomyces TaxID=2593676 RepID=UPI00324D4347